MCLPSEGLGPKMCRSCVACIVPCQACATQWWCFGGCGRARYGLLFRWHHVSKNVKSWTRQDSEYFSCVVSFVSLHIIPLTQSSKRLFKHIETTWTELNYIVLLGSPCQHLSWLWKERERDSVLPRHWGGLCQHLSWDWERTCTGSPGCTRNGHHGISRDRFVTGVSKFVKVCIQNAFK